MALPHTSLYPLSLRWTFLNAATFDPLFGFVFCRHGCSAPNTRSVICFWGVFRLFDKERGQQNAVILERNVRKQKYWFLGHKYISTKRDGDWRKKNVFFILSWQSRFIFLVGPWQMHLPLGVKFCGIALKYYFIHYRLFSDIWGKSRSCSDCYLNIFFTASKSRRNPAIKCTSL